jgi:hypothetical protein
MSNVDTRQVNRDSLFLLALLRVDGRQDDFRIKVRNLSPGGMMAEGEVKVTRGSRVSVELRNIGWVEGTVAWKQDSRFGIAFLEDVDPLLARAPTAADGVNFEAPRFVRSLQSLADGDPTRLRKI